METIYGQLGGYAQQIGGDCPAGWVVMDALRPDLDHVALADGAWAIPAKSRADIEAERLRAYADPLVGSDRFFSESIRESLIGNHEAAEQAKQRGLSRYSEIQAELPWPDGPAPDPVAPPTAEPEAGQPQ